MLIKLFNKIFRRQKEFYEIDSKYGLIQNVNLESEEWKIQLANELKSLNSKENLNDLKILKLKNRKPIKFKSIDKSINECERLINQENDVTSREAIENNWDFHFSIRQIAEIQDTILITNSLTSATKQMGNILYNVAAIYKIKEEYLVWDLC